MQSELTVATWWGFAEGDRTIVGVVVIAVAVLAVAFVVSRVLSRRRKRS
jgi:hypothetical protein